VCEASISSLDCDVYMSGVDDYLCFGEEGARTFWDDIALHMAGRELPSPELAPKPAEYYLSHATYYGSQFKFKP
jgi:hypothetical protein